MPENVAMALPLLVATRYVLPLREGGSLPAIVDTDGSGEYVVKFKGAGQGPKALVAEVIAANLASALGLPVPAPAIVELAEGFGEAEPDPEIQDLLRGSVGKNFGLAYLPGALGYDPVADASMIDADLAAAIVWFDALITNVDRGPRNPNLLAWDGKVWLIDHGVALYFQYLEVDWQTRAGDAFPQIEQHILLGRAGDIRAAHERLRPLLMPDVVTAAVADVPDEWLDPSPALMRERYVRYLEARLDGRLDWVEEAERARRSR